MKKEDYSKEPPKIEGMKECLNSHEQGKKMVFELPRYEKRSLWTLVLALILPSAIYGFQLIHPRTGAQWWTVVSFFAHPFAVIINTVSDVGLAWSTMFSMFVNFLVIFWLHKTQKLTTKKVFALGISLGMVNLLGLKLLNYFPQ